MRLEPMIRHIEAADYISFREIVLLTLQARGYAEGQLTDGPYDGGQDIKVRRGPQETDDLLIQISVERKWEKKVRAEAQRAYESGRRRIEFYSGCRISYDSQVKVIDGLRKTCPGLTLTFVDSQAIASVLNARGCSDKLLEILGLAESRPNLAAIHRPAFRQEATYAAAFFGSDTRNFRESVLENALVVYLERQGGEAQVSGAIADVALELRLGQGQRQLLQAALDRLRQQGALLGKNGTVTLQDDMIAHVRGAQRWAQQSEQALRTAIEAHLVRRLPNARQVDHTLAAIMPAINALLAHVPDGPLVALGRADPDATASLRRQVEALRQTLVAAVGTNSEAQVLLQEITEQVSLSDYGRLVATGELFLQLTRLGLPHLIQALGGSSTLNLALDASVAMPMLCALYHGSPGRLRFFLAAKALYDRCREHHIAPVLPRVYLEEIASHLVSAYHNYRDIIQLDPDLAGSQNAFVAHYAALHQTGAYPGSFGTYLEDFGLSRALAGADFPIARDGVMRSLENLLGRYGIQVDDLRAAPATVRQAQESLLWMKREREESESGPPTPGRPDVLLKHDVSVLASLLEREANGDQVWILCTWDRQLRDLPDLPVQVQILDPLNLAELLGLLAGEEAEIHLCAAPIAAIALGTATQEQGARVLDLLVRLERDELADAALRRQILDFKKSYMAHARNDLRDALVIRDWEAWRLRTLGPRRAASS